MTQVFCVTYILSCITKLTPNYSILMLGRVLGGISTSLLFSVFEVQLPTRWALIDVYRGQTKVVEV